MLRTALILAAILALASCSLQLDSQYGLRLGPAAIKRDAPGGKPTNSENLDQGAGLLAAKPSALLDQATEAIESELAANPNYSVEFDASIFSDQSHSTNPDDFAFKASFETESDLSEAADLKPEAQAPREAAVNSQSKPLWLPIVALVFGILLMTMGLLTFFFSILSLLLIDLGPALVIMGFSLLGLLLGYLLFRWAKRNLPEIRMPNWFYDRRVRLILGLVLGLLVLLLTGF